MVLLAVILASGAVDPGSFHYLGAFRLPEGGERPHTFQYGGEAMTWLPGDPGTLLVMGHNSMPYGELPDGNRVAEVSIPSPVMSCDIEDLPRAELLTGFVPLFEELFPGMDEIPRAGMEWDGSRLHLCRGQHLEESPPLTTGLAMLEGDTVVAGPWRISGCVPYSTNDYIFSAPSLWADSHAGGRTMLTGRYRDGGWGGMGPSLYAYLPPDPGWSGSYLPAIPLLQYRTSLDTDLIEGCIPGYQHADEWTGGAWVEDGSGNQAVLFCGTKGTGDLYWYGYRSSLGPCHPCVEREMTGEFTMCRRADGSPAEGDLCQGEPVSFRGWWSSEFAAGFLLYDPSDLAQVASGELSPREPQPYAFIEVDEHLFLPAGLEEEMLGAGVQRRFRLGDAAWDGENHLLYVLELFADGCAPVVHVWRVGN